MRARALLALTAVAVLAAGLTTAISNRPPPVDGADPSAVPDSGSVVAAGFSRGLAGRRGSTKTIPTSFRSGGATRDVIVHVPDGLLAPAPLLIALHGRAQLGEAIRRYSRFDALADREGFVVAYPDGVAGSWNADGCCSPATGKGVDDIAFLDEVLRLVQSRTPIDPDRIAMTGGSNGAMMALDYACERPDVISAVAVVSGPYVSRCRPTRPTPVLELHGGRDTLVPLQGGVAPSLGVTFPAVSASFDAFRAAGSEVKVQVVPSAGHQWMTRDATGVDASSEIWDWVRDHPLLAS